MASALPEERLRVGLVLKGNPQFEKDHDRSLPGLDLFVPLGSLAGVRLVSLRKGEAKAEARHPPAGLSLFDLGSRVDNFADSAAIVASHDLVIWPLSSSYSVRLMPPDLWIT